MIESDIIKYNFDNRKFLFFDFEGDLNLFYSQPFQVAYSIYHGKKMISHKSVYIKWPKFAASKRVKVITKIDPKIVEEQGVDPFLVFQEFAELMYDKQYSIVGANTLNFDTMVFYNCLKRLGLPHDYSFLRRCYDTNALFKGWKLGKVPDYKNFLAWQYSMNSYVRKGLKSNVAYCAREFQIEVDENKAHEALYDIGIESQIFFNLVDKMNLK